MKETIDILMATYNGGAFLREQIESIIGQSHKQWKLLVRDDGSDDETPAILMEYKNKYPQNIILLNDDRQNLGVVGNYSRLLEHSTAAYIMFCDQDDIWKSDKIERTLGKMLQVEEGDRDCPVLIFTDLELVDQKRELISRSMWEYQKVDPVLCQDVYYLSILNPVTGCTVMVNRKAKEVASPIAPEACMHDWWLALNVAYKGVIDYIDYAAIQYRQHAANVTTTSKVSLVFFMRKLGRLKTVLRNNYQVYKMLKALNFNIYYSKVLLYKIKFLFKRVFPF